MTSIRLSQERLTPLPTGPRSSASRPKARLAIGIIVRDAAEYLAATLGCAAEIADQLVVADTGSQDGTVALARKSADTVLTLPWQNSFSAARNAALEAMSADWVLWLDAGETLDPEEALALRDFVDAEASSGCLYYLNIKIPPPFAGASSEQVARLRLMPVRPGLRFAGRVAERIDAPELQLIELPWTILRGSREHLPAVRTARAERNLRLAQMELSEEGPHARYLNTIGEAHLQLGRREQAAAAFAEACRLAQPESLDLLESYYGQLTAVEDTPAGRELRISLCLDALEVFPLDAQLLCTLGTYMQTARRLELASRSFRAAVEYGQVRPAAWHLANLAEVAVNCLVTCLEELGQAQEAVAVLRQAIQDHPNSERLRRRLLDGHLERAELKEALELASELAPEGTQRDLLRSVVRGACLGREQRWISALAYLQTAFLAGFRDPLCCKWLATALTETGSHAAAQSVLKEWQAAEPHAAEAARMLAEVEAQLPSAVVAERSSVPGFPNSGLKAGDSRPSESPDRIVHVHKQDEILRPRLAPGKEMPLVRASTQPVEER